MLTSFIGCVDIISEIEKICGTVQNEMKQNIYNYNGRTYNNNTVSEKYCFQRKSMQMKKCMYTNV